MESCNARGRSRRPNGRSPETQACVADFHADFSLFFFCFRNLLSKHGQIPLKKGARKKKGEKGESVNTGINLGCRASTRVQSNFRPVLHQFVCFVEMVASFLNEPPSQPVIQNTTRSVTVTREAKGSEGEPPRGLLVLDLMLLLQGWGEREIKLPLHLFVAITVILI